MNIRGVTWGSSKDLGVYMYRYRGKGYYWYKKLVKRFLDCGEINSKENRNHENGNRKNEKLKQNTNP